jgi:hypothetical protein
MPRRALQIQDSVVVIRVIVVMMDTLRILTFQVGLDKDQRHHTAIQEARGQTLIVVREAWDLEILSVVLEVLDLDLQILLIPQVCRAELQVETAGSTSSVSPANPT